MITNRKGEIMLKKAEENNMPQKHQNRKNYNQYFTPEFAVEKALSLISEITPENIIDPAVGNGVFLKIASKKWQKSKLFGIDIDKNVIFELNKSNPCLQLTGTSLSNFYFTCGDSLLQKTWELPEIQKVLSKGGFDLVVGNPPFSSWFHRIDSKDILSFYELAKSNGDLKKSQAIEILFLENFIKLAKKRGFIVIVLPDGILSNPQYQYVREFILKNTKVLHIISLPRNVFEETSAKTSILILQKDIVKILNYKLPINDLGKNGIVNHTIKIIGNDLINRMDYWYYHKLKKSSIRQILNNGLEIKKLKDFVTYCKTGKTVYGKDRKFAKKGLRFLHSTNITDAGINYKKDEKFIKPKSNMDISRSYAKAGDILLVRVGDGCIGRTAIVASKKDIGVVSDCIFMIRIKGISPYFIAIYLKTKFGKNWINLQKHGSATTCITKSDILSLPIPLLNKKAQQVVERNYNKILDDYRNTLNGKKDINGVLEKLNLLIQYVENRVEQVIQR